MSDRTDCSEDSCFQEDESFHDHYEIDGLIGHGGSAKVYEVHRKGSWQRFACKVSPLIPASAAQALTQCTCRRSAWKEPSTAQIHCKQSCRLSGEPTIPMC